MELETNMALKRFLEQCRIHLQEQRFTEQGLLEDINHKNKMINLQCEF